MSLLRVRDISRQSGGMDIKLKDKILFLLKIIIGACVIFMICFGIFYVVDIYGNGLVLDWIADKFVSKMCIRDRG